MSVEISPGELYEKFGNGDAKSLVSFQAIVALFLYYGGESITAKRAMDEWKSNLTFQSLSKENDKYVMNFEKLGEIVYYFLRAFLTLENDFEKSEQSKLELVKSTIDSASVDFSIEEAPEIVQTSTPKRSPIHRPTIPPSLLNMPDSITERDSAFLKAALTMSKPNLDASIEAAEEENENILRNIIDPTPGLTVDDIFTDADLNKAQDENEAKFRLGNAAEKRLDTVLDDINRNISFENESSILFSKRIADGRKDFVVDKSNENIELSKSTFQIKIDTVKQKTIKRRSPYELRSRKRQFVDSVESLLHNPFVHQSIPDPETNKIKAAESIVDSIVKQLPDQRKKLKFDLDETNDIKLTEL